jgi:RNA polymerase sigma-70 factor, ECF subfamily
MRRMADIEAPGFEAEAEGPARVAALLMRHRTDLLAYLLAAVRNPHDAEDILQEVCVAATRSWTQYREGTPFTAWAREIARRRVLEYGRATRKRPALLDPDVLARLDEVASEMEAAEPADARKDALRECLAGLGGVAHRVVELRYRARHAVPEVAASIGRTLHATYAILKRTRQALRECVERRMKESLT